MKGGKVYVVDENEESRVPFLRGILTRSLQDSGLSFETAYKYANDIREIVDGEVTTTELKKIVSNHLKRKGELESLALYTEERSNTFSITVVDQDEQGQPFSRSRLARTLEWCAFSGEKSYALAEQIEAGLVRNKITTLTSHELADTVYDFLKKEESKKMAERYKIWVKFSRSGRPMFLLIGGTTGTGKSTISSELAHRLNIVRTQSTDMLREVMRLMIPAHLLPTLHTSSFSAWTKLPVREGAELAYETHLEDGFLTQASHVAVSIEGVVRRAERERVSLILEGVHVHPGLTQNLKFESDVLIIPLMLAVVKRKRLKKRLEGRGHQVSLRRSARYLDNFDAIWRLQDYLLSEADQYDVPIIPNDDYEDSIQLIMETVSEMLEKEYNGRSGKSK